MVSIVEALADCLETLRRGDDLEACLDRYPMYRTQLEALLEVSTLIRPLPEDVAPSSDFRKATRSRILDAGRELQSHRLSAIGEEEEAPEVC